MSTIATRTFQQGLNYYVPAMQAGGTLGQALEDRIDMGTPAVAAAANLLSAQSIAAAVDTTTLLLTAALTQTESVMGKYGRTLQVVASGAASSTVDVYGRDYLGQKIRETLTLNGTTTVQGKKAFRYVDRVVAGVTSGTTINLGTSTGLGLPYVTEKIDAEYVDEVSGTLGTLTAPILTDPQTATTGDPRGTYVPSYTPNGTKRLKLDCRFSNYTNASGNGGMHGIQHIGA
jgi:hypothetical protein